MNPDTSPPTVVVVMEPTPATDTLRASFQIRRVERRGYFLTRPDIERRRAGRTTELLRDIPGLVLRRTGYPYHDYIVTMQQRSEPISFALVCTVTYYIDGTLQSGGEKQLFVNKAIRPGEIEALEVYTDPNGLPPEFPQLEGGCGVVVIWRLKSAK